MKPIAITSKQLSRFMPEHAGEQFFRIALTSYLAMGLANDACAIAFYDPSFSQNHFDTVGQINYDWLSGVGQLYTSAGLCTASAIAPRVVLTAAHCADGNAANGFPGFVNGTAKFFNANGVASTRNGNVYIYPGYSAYGSVAAYDVAVMLLDTPLPNDIRTYQVYDGLPNKFAIDVMTSSPFFTTGYGQYYEEGWQIGDYGYGRYVGLNNIDGFSSQAGGVLGATLGWYEGIPQHGDSGGPLLFYQSYPYLTGTPVILGITSYINDTGLNYSFADIGDKAYWTYVGNYTNWIVSMAALTGDEVVLSSFDYKYCPPGTICKPGDGLLPSDEIVVDFNTLELLPPAPAPTPEPGTIFLLMLGLPLILLKRQTTKFEAENISH